MKRLAWIALVVVVVAAIGIAYAARSRGNHGLTVEAEPVARREIVQTVAATGKIQPSTQVNISADVSAKIIRLLVEDGDRVEKGALLLELERERYLAAVESAEANLSAAEANALLVQENLNKASKDLVRSEALHAKELESQAALDSTAASAAVEHARLRATLDQVEQARAALKQAKDDLAKTAIYAPISGTVSRLNKEQGEIALGSQFQEDVILVLSNLAGMEALVDVDENDIVSLTLGDLAEIEVDALPDVVFKGEVAEIANTAKVSGSGTTDQKTEFEVKIAILDPGTHLRPGMTAAAEIVTETRAEAVAVPIQAVAVRTVEELGVARGEGEADRFHPDRDGFVDIVWVVEEGVARARQVEPGIQGESHLEIAGGLESGELVVVGSYRAISRDLTDGAAVVVAEGAGEAAPGRSS